METVGARIIQHPAIIQAAEQAVHEDQSIRVAADNQQSTESAGSEPVAQPDVGTSAVDFLTALAEFGVNEERARSERNRVLGEVNVLRAENRWGDILALFHPVEEKLPELDALGLATPVRAEAAFALGHLGRQDEAIELYTRCIAEEPDNFHYHSGLAYAAYDTLYAAKGRQLMLHPTERRARIELAHLHFAVAQSLRPDRVTNYYRQGMLFKKIQGKSGEALPLFETAVRNWDAYSEDEKKARHQERKNCVKALYQLASCHLEAQKPVAALEVITRCLGEDEESGYFSAVHKYFALGKVHFELNDPAQALHALTFAAAQANPEDDDYVFELLARVHLSRGDVDKAWEAINRVPFKRRRPYFRWTEADVLIARGDWERARKVLLEAAERDRRGRHKALLRLARLEFRRNRFEQCLLAAEEADRFFQNQFRNPCGDGLLWQAAALLRLGRIGDARDRAQRLAECMPHHPHLGKLRQLIAAAAAAGIIVHQ
jgi:tetratricopeptide (TPR) repeat protein